MLFYAQSSDQMLSNCLAETGNQGLSYPRHPRAMCPPLNSVECVEAYYGPQFSQHSHVFRPKKGCHTALIDIHETWTGTKWFIEGDIKGCFDNLDHHTLMHIL